MAEASSATTYNIFMNADELMQLANFWPARLLLSAAELDIFAHLVGPADANDVAAAIGTDPRATGVLLDALSAIGCLEKAGGMYSVPEHLQELLLPGPGCVVPSVLHRNNLWRSWSHLTEVVRSGQPAVEPYEDDQRPDEQVREFIGAMAVGAREEAPKTVAAIGFEGVKSVIDIGGGPGVYAAEFCRAGEGVHAVILDLPRVCEIAGENLADDPVGQRVGFVPGEARTVSDTAVLAASGGNGYDVVFTSNLVHSMDPTQVQVLVRRMVRWARPGGRVVVKDFFVNDERTAPPPAVVFSVNMLVNTPGGRSYQWTEVEGWLRDAALEAGIRCEIERRILPDSHSGLLVLQRLDDPPAKG